MECTQRIDYDEEPISEAREIGYLGILGQKHPVRLGPNKIGRDPELCDIIINVESVSRQHALINVLSSSEIMMMDLGSVNVTKIGKEVLKPYLARPIHNGDILQFGTTFGIFCLTQNSDDFETTQHVEAIPDTPACSRKMMKPGTNFQQTIVPESPDSSDKRTPPYKLIRISQNGKVESNGVSNGWVGTSWSKNNDDRPLKIEHPSPESNWNPQSSDSKRNNMCSFEVPQHEINHLLYGSDGENEDERTTQNKKTITRGSNSFNTLRSTFNDLARHCEIDNSFISPSQVVKKKAAIKNLIIKRKDLMKPQVKSSDSVFWKASIQSINMDDSMETDGTKEHYKDDSTSKSITEDIKDDDCGLKLFENIHEMSTQMPTDIDKNIHELDTQLPDDNFEKSHVSDIDLQEKSIDGLKDSFKDAIDNDDESKTESKADTSNSTAAYEADTQLLEHSQTPPKQLVLSGKDEKISESDEEIIFDEFETQTFTQNFESQEIFKQDDQNIKIIEGKDVSDSVKSPVDKESFNDDLIKENIVTSKNIDSDCSTDCEEIDGNFVVQSIKTQEKTPGKSDTNTNQSEIYSKKNINVDISKCSQNDLFSTPESNVLKENLKSLTNICNNKVNAQIVFKSNSVVMDDIELMPTQIVDSNSISNNLDKIRETKLIESSGNNTLMGDIENMPTQIIEENVKNITLPINNENVFHLNKANSFKYKFTSGNVALIDDIENMATQIIDENLINVPLQTNNLASNTKTDVIDLTFTQNTSNLDDSPDIFSCAVEVKGGNATESNHSKIDENFKVPSLSLLTCNKSPKKNLRFNSEKKNEKNQSNNTKIPCKLNETTEKASKNLQNKQNSITGREKISESKHKNMKVSTNENLQNSKGNEAPMDDHYYNSTQDVLEDLMTQNFDDNVNSNLPSPQIKNLNIDCLNTIDNNLDSKNNNKHVEKRKLAKQEIRPEKTGLTRAKVGKGSRAVGKIPDSLSADNTKKKRKNSSRIISSDTSDNSDSDLSPKKKRKYRKSGLLRMELPDSQEIEKTCRFQNKPKTSVVTDSSGSASSESEGDNNLIHKKSAKRKLKLPVIDNLQAVVIPSRFSKRLKTPTEKILQNENLKTIITRKEFRSSDQNSDNGENLEICIDNLKMIQNKGTRANTPVESKPSKITKKASTVVKSEESDKNKGEHESISKRIRNTTNILKNSSQGQTEKKTYGTRNKNKVDLPKVKPNLKRKNSSSENEKPAVQRGSKAKKNTEKQLHGDRSAVFGESSSNLTSSSLDSRDSLSNVSKTRSRVQLKSSKVPKNSKESSQEISPSISRASTSRLSLRAKPKVMFTGVAERKLPVLAKLVTTLGGSQTDDIDACTVLVTEKLKRTVKLLCCVGLGRPIVSTAWLDACRKSNNFVDPWKYLLKDNEAEAKFGCSLIDTLTGPRNFLQGWHVSSTPKVEMPPANLERIVKCSGGTYVKCHSAAKGEKGWLCVTAKEDAAKWPDIRQKGATLVLCDAIIEGIMVQKLDIKKYLIK